MTGKDPFLPKELQYAVRKKKKPTNNTATTIAKITPHQSFPDRTNRIQNVEPINPKIRQVIGKLNFRWYSTSSVLVLMPLKARVSILSFRLRESISFALRFFE